MQDAIVGSWAGSPHSSAENLESLRDLNHRFLDLTAARGGGWAAAGAGVPLDLAGRIAPLSAPQREAAAGCPYALFDLRFQDERILAPRLQNLDDWGVADESPVDDDTASFVRLALFYAWHICRERGPQRPAAVRDERRAPSRRSAESPSTNWRRLVATEAANLSARWSDCTAFWSALTAAAARRRPRGAAAGATSRAAARRRGAAAPVSVAWPTS